MCCDYGFRTGAARLYQEQYGEVPSNIFEIVSRRRAASASAQAGAAPAPPLRLPRAWRAARPRARPRRPWCPRPQAWDNFQGELQALRRSVRNDEYAQISEQRADKGLLSKVGVAAQGLRARLRGRRRGCGPGPAPSRRAAGRPRRPQRCCSCS
jgi:hypothetical protein